MYAVARASINFHRPPDSDQANRCCAVLIAKIAVGDESALAELYDVTIPLLLGLAFRILKDRSIAEEVVLETYLQVWQQANNYNNERGKPLTWLTIMARSRALDRLRSIRCYEGHEGRFAAITFHRRNSDNPEENALMEEMRKIIRHAVVSELLPKEREVIELAYLSGLSHTEIALIVEIPLGTVKTRIRSGIRKLRRSMELILGDF